MRDNVMDPRGIAVEADGSLVVVDSGLDAVVRVDPTTGDRTIISMIIDPDDPDDMGMGMGPVWELPRGIAVEENGSLVVVDSVLDTVVRVDPETGDRTIISDNEMGIVPAFVNPSGIAVEENGSLVVVDYGLDAVVRVHPETGDRTIISNRRMGMGSGPDFLNPFGIAVEENGSLVVVDTSLKAVVRVHPTTGDREIISKRIDTVTKIDMNMVGSGPAFQSPSGIAVEPDGSLVVVDSGLDAVVRVDPETGDRTIISMMIIDPDDPDDMGRGRGISFSLPRGIAVETW